MILLVLILVSLYTPPSPDNCTVYLLTGYSHGGDQVILIWLVFIGWESREWGAGSGSKI